MGHVSKITANEEVALELRGPQQVDSKSTHGTAQVMHLSCFAGRPMGYQPRLPSGVCHLLKEI